MCIPVPFGFAVEGTASGSVATDPRRSLMQINEFRTGGGKRPRLRSGGNLRLPELSKSIHNEGGAIMTIRLPKQAFTLTLALALSVAAYARSPENVSGGIGVAEQVELAAREKEFNLKLVFTLVEGNYLADVGVTVVDSGGHKVIEHVSPGPLFMARLPAGHYRVTATFDGKSVTREVDVAAGRLRTEYLRWPSDPSRDLPVSRWIER
jgi:hypothetical protein